MSVYKSKRGTSAMQFIETARQLEAHTFACCIKAPKRYSFFLTSRIMELASEVHDHVRAANNIWPTNQHEAPMRPAGRCLHGGGMCSAPVYPQGVRGIRRRHSR